MLDEWKTGQFKLHVRFSLKTPPFALASYDPRKKELHSKAMLTLLRPKDRENKVLFIALSFTTPVIGEFCELCAGNSSS